MQIPALVFLYAMQVKPPPNMYN